MKLFHFFLILLILIPTVIALDECPPITDPRTGGNCLVTSTWNYTSPCNLSIAQVFNEDGTSIGNFTFQSFGDSQRCSFVWNISQIGSYYYNVNNGDTGNITIDRGSMLDIIIGLIAAMFLFGVGGKIAKGLALKLLGYGVAMIQLVNIMFVLYVNEVGGSLVSTLRINFYISLILAFGIGMVSMIILLIRIMNPMDEFKDHEIKWQGK